MTNSNPRDRSRHRRRARDELGEPGRRRAYDAQRLTLRPVRPGRLRYDVTGKRRLLRRPGQPLCSTFGRHAGWRLEDLVRHGEGYVRWLARHSSGIQFRTVIKQLISHGDLDRPAQAVG